MQLHASFIWSFMQTFSYRGNYWFFGVFIIFNKFILNMTWYVNQVFGRTVICRDLDVATSVARNNSLDCITLEGMNSEHAHILSLIWFLTLCTASGDQVSKKGGMTGGFYDFRRSKLKFVNIVRQNKMSIHAKTLELDEIGKKLKDILKMFSFHALSWSRFYLTELLQL